MDKLISLLTSFFSLHKIASVSVPGILAAAAVAILLYPPRPLDVVPRVEFLITAEDLPKALAQLQEKGGPACKIDHIALHTGIPTSVEEMRIQAQNDQHVLDMEQSNLAKCIELENSMKGKEISQNTQWNADIEILRKDESDIQSAYQAYEKANNPLRNLYRRKYEEASARIEDVRNKILRNEQRIRERERRLAELARESNVIAERLKDPGRLRPRQAFDEFITSLANHAIGLALLAIAVGVLMNPINRAIFAPIYDLTVDQ